jgi:hypothetical protein
MGPKHSSWNVTCLSGICFKGSSYPSIETRIGLLAKTWHVSMGGRFHDLVSRLMFCDVRFLTSENKRQATTRTWHVSMLVCSRAPTTCAWKLVSSHLKASDTFTTCRWNNIKDHGLQQWAKHPFTYSLENKMGLC